MKMRRSIRYWFSVLSPRTLEVNVPGHATLKNLFRLFAISGWLIAIASAIACMMLFLQLEKSILREQDLRKSTAGLAMRIPTPDRSDRPLLLITGDSRASQLGNDSLGGFDVVNRGVPGQTTPEVLARIGRDMAVIRPAHVVVIAGVNDLKNGVRSPEDLVTINRSFEEMLLIGEAMDIPMTICPVWGASSKSTLRGLALAPDLGRHVEDLNLLLLETAEERSANLAEIDPLLDERNLMRKSLSSDALHLNAAGIEILRKSLLESLDSIDGDGSD
ncbi:MAG: hypothetical protein CMJ54_01310 [Planctomycetaceae bacterium]|nr:hypothetical protein [Planctomycetaceae bacterium]